MFWEKTETGQVLTNTGNTSQTGSTWALIKTIEESIQALTQTWTLSTWAIDMSNIWTPVGTSTWTIGPDFPTATWAQVQTGAVENVSTWSQVLTKDVVTDFPGKWKLLALVFHAVEQKTRGFWDKKIDISKVHTSWNAAIGKWWTEETHWSWIAWKNTDNVWKVLLDNDGYSCKELENIPPELKEFFKTEITIDGRSFCFN